MGQCRVWVLERWPAGPRLAYGVSDLKQKLWWLHFTYCRILHHLLAPAPPHPPTHSPPTHPPNQHFHLEGLAGPRLACMVCLNVSTHSPSPPTTHTLSGQPEECISHTNTASPACPCSTSPTHSFSPPHSQANLRNAILERAVFTRSDLGGANVEGADFTNALLDKTQQMVRAGLEPWLLGLRGRAGTRAVFWFGVWREQQGGLLPAEGGGSALWDVYSGSRSSHTLTDWAVSCCPCPCPCLCCCCRTCRRCASMLMV